MERHRAFSGSVRVYRRFAALLLAVCCMAVATGTAEAQENLSVLGDWRVYVDPSDVLYSEIAREAYRYLDERERLLAGIRTKEDFGRYADNVDRKLAAAFGPLPPRTPLNARVTGTLEPGKEADIVALDGDPTENINALWNIAEVFLAGRRIDRGSAESIAALRQLPSGGL